VRAARLLALAVVTIAVVGMPASRPPALAARLRAALAAKGPGYRPHTRHLNSDGTPKYTNRLILESSPYLLQHAHNPVDWFPWGDEAFAKAAREGKPVLLSVGYSTCHWCHVMEEESFEDEEIAAYLNANYVAIKVDREERPDVDAVYMAAVQAMGQRGGWPMTLWLTPSREPFYAATYLPPRAGVRGARVGFLELLERLKQVFDENPGRVATAAADIAARVARTAPAGAAEAIPDAAPIRAAVVSAKRRFDATNGGFGGAPKFPRPAELALLLRYHRRTGDAAALTMVTRTLDAMARGGIHDQIGGGFHRYSTDAAWLVPHFEKMLYDNALLAVAYLEAYQATGAGRFADVARDVLDYVARDMTDPSGAFWAATDADSAGEEGAFYVWTPAAIRAAVGDADAPFVLAYYGVTAAGNFDGKNVLHVPRPLADVATDLSISETDARARLGRARARLLAARAKRVPPHTDRKVIAAWNGLMISAFAQAARVLGEPAYARTAARAMDAVLAQLARGDRLARHAVAGRATGAGYLDDYAFVVAGLLDLWEATYEPRWLERAVALQRTLDEGFQDRARGGYFATATWHERLLVREKPDYDGAEPSGNSVELENLLRLGALTADDTYRASADALLRAFGPTLARTPDALPRMLCGLDFRLDRAREIVVVTPATAAQAEPFLAVLRRTFLPSHVSVVGTAGPALASLARRLPPVAGKTVTTGRATAYVCERGVCELPTTDPAVFARQIAAVEPLP
jgi:uncharacterized protein YyaL (SSP411 family)